MDLGNAFRLYKVKEDHKFVASKISSYKIFKYRIIPKEEGVFRIPDLKLSFLNPETGEYYDEYVKLPTFKVKTNKNAPKITDESYNDVESTLDGTTKDPVESLEFKENISGFSFFEIVYFRLSSLWTLFILFIVFVLSFFLFKRVSYVPPVSEDLGLELEQRALRVASLLKENKRNESLSELINILSLLVGAVNGKRFERKKKLKWRLNLCLRALSLVV